MKKSLAHIIAIRVFACLLVFYLPSSSPAEVLKRDHVEVRLITTDASPNQDDFQVGVHFKIDPDWHVYWKNPGDSGAAPKFELTGGEIRQIQWPYPVRLPVAHLTNFGYDKEVVFPLSISFEKQTPTSQEQKFVLDLEWLVCKVECIPGFGTFEFTKASLTSDPTLFAKYQKQVPSSTSAWTTEFIEKTDTEFKFKLLPPPLASASALTQIKNLFVYPENGELFQTALPALTTTSKFIEVSVPFTTNADRTVKTAAFTFVTESLDGKTTAFAANVESAQQASSWVMGLVFAFFGGIILNLMPCVFPVLFLKAFGFLKEPDQAKIRRSSWAYTAGVILTFFLFGALLSLLRFYGEAIGWGYQLQNPVVVYGLALLFFAMALNFYGYFEMGDAVMSKAGALGSKKFFSGSFGTGVLAVVVASPCTAPFMGTALGLTLLLPAYQSLLIFVSLGAGMAMPMLLLAYIPQLVNRLPRSGPWMIVVKQFLSFPLFATSLWLLWVLSHQKGPEAVFITLSSFLAITIGIWLLNSSQRKYLRFIAWLVVIGAPIASVTVLKSITVAPLSPSTAWTPFNESLIEDKRKTQSVFVDFTASWCITCQVNKRTVLETEEIQALFKTHDVFLVRADWTNQDPAITNALAKFGRNSVPFYVYYNKMGEVQKLPEILTKDLVREVIQGVKK